MRLLPALLLATVAAPAIAQRAAPASPVAPLQFTDRTLPNGLRVLALRDTKTANVAIRVAYHVGAKDDPAGRSGFAHLFEHLMFKATRNLPDEAFDRMTEDVGGYNNASTGDDVTEFHEVVPASQLGRLLFAEADRMAGLVVGQAAFVSERQVVEEELRQRTLADPYGQLTSIDYPKVAYTVSPYARPAIGSIADLDAASLDDVRAFHQIYYRPDNAVLVVAGNFDPAQLDRWVDQYFAGIARPAVPIPRVTATEPVRTAPLVRTVYADNAPLPALLVSWHVPADRDPDNAALTVLDAILSTGESSRLYRRLVYRDGLAQSANSFVDSREGIGNFAVYAVAAGGKPIAAVEAALREEVARLRDAPVAASELARAKNQVVTATLRARETAEGRAAELASATLIDGDPHASDAELAQIARVTPADVQRVARAYLGEAAAATIRYLPAAAKPAGATAAPIEVAATVQAQPLAHPADLQVVTALPASERRQPPAAGPAVAAALPHPVATQLGNGLTVVTVARHDLPIVSVVLVAGGGAATDPAGRAGASSLAADLLTKGTASRSATQIAGEVEALGGSIGAGAARDGVTVSLTVKSDGLAAGLAVLADVAQHPAFAAAEVARARAQAIDNVAVELADPAVLAGLTATRTVFPGSPYGQPLAGTAASLKAITAADLARAYAGTFRPGQTTLLLVGDVTPDAAQALAQRLFGGWQGAATPSAAAVPLAAPGTPRTVVIDVPSAGQAGVVVARPSLSRTDPDYYPLLVANQVLGGGYSARLNQEIRVKRGLAYGAGSQFAARRTGGLLAARTQTRNDGAADAVALTEAAMTTLGREPVPETELTARKTALLGDFGRSVETTDGIAGLLAEYVLAGVPLGELDRYAARVTAVDTAAVQKAAAAGLDPTAASIVVAGDAKTFLPALRRAHPQVEVVPQAALVLDGAALR